jgi:hypothetical protein
MSAVTRLPSPPPCTITFPGSSTASSVNSTPTSAQPRGSRIASRLPPDAAGCRRPRWRVVATRVSRRQERASSWDDSPCRRDIIPRRRKVLQVGRHMFHFSSLRLRLDLPQESATRVLSIGLLTGTSIHLRIKRGTRQSRIHRDYRERKSDVVPNRTGGVATKPMGGDRFSRLKGRARLDVGENRRRSRHDAGRIAPGTLRT